MSFDADASAASADSWVASWANEIFPVCKDVFDELFRTIPSRVQEKMPAEKDKREKKRLHKKEKDERKAARKARKTQSSDKDEEEDDPANDEEDAEVSDDQIAQMLMDKFMKETMEEVTKHKEKSSVHLNLAWTNPSANSKLGKDISFEKVQKCAIDMFVEKSEAAKALGEASPATADEAENKSTPQMSLQEHILGAGKISWKIPDKVDKKYSIPIMVLGPTAAEPVRGQFTRLALDCFVNATWLAMSWAIKAKDEQAVSKLKKLILDWPMDFILISGDTPEKINENKFKFAVNLSAQTETLREYVGLAQENLLMIIGEAVKFVNPTKNMTQLDLNKAVLDWLAKYINWGVHQTPDLPTVERHMRNLKAIEACPKVLKLIESATTRWGRNHLLDYPTKLQIIVRKTDPNSILYVVQTLTAHMWRKNDRDPYSTTLLPKVVDDILWVRSYERNFTRRYSDIFDETQHAALSYINNPLDFFRVTEGPNKDPTWAQSYGVEALRMYMKHSLELKQGVYAPELNGALRGNSKGAKGFTMDAFHLCGRVETKFFSAFLMAYDALKPRAASADEMQAVQDAVQDAGGDAEQNAGGEHSQGGEPGQGRKTKAEELNAFKKNCESKTKEELDARYQASLSWKLRVDDVGDLRGGPLKVEGGRPHVF